jgi:hypothetical protein
MLIGGEVLKFLMIMLDAWPVIDLPLHIATTEYSCSAMNIIKTEIRNKMNDEWVDDNMVCYIKRGIFGSIEDDIILWHFHYYTNLAC